MIADVKDGVMIDGRGSYSIDQQRFNGQLGGHIFWEIKNGKITRQCTDVTYNAITTDFWANLDAVTGPSEYQKHGTGGDATGQPTQTNSISHGSMTVGARIELTTSTLNAVNSTPTDRHAAERRLFWRPTAVCSEACRRQALRSALPSTWTSLRSSPARKARPSSTNATFRPRTEC